MTIWKILEIEETADETIIRKAYSLQAAKFHPEEHPVEFQQIQAAYKSAMQYARSIKRQKKSDVVESEKYVTPPTVINNEEAKTNDAETGAGTDNQPPPTQIAFVYGEKEPEPMRQEHDYNQSGEKEQPECSTDYENKTCSDYDYEYVEKEAAAVDCTEAAAAFLNRMYYLYENKYTKNNLRAWEILFQNNAIKDLIKNQDFVYKLMMEIKDYSGINSEIFRYIYRTLKLTPDDKWYDLANHTFEQKIQGVTKNYKNYSKKIDDFYIRSIIYKSIKTPANMGSLIKNRRARIFKDCFIAVLAIIVLFIGSLVVIVNPVKNIARNEGYAYTLPTFSNLYSYESFTLPADFSRSKPTSSDVLKEFRPYDRVACRERFVEEYPYYVDINFDGKTDMIYHVNGVVYVKTWNKSTGSYEMDYTLGISPNIVVDSRKKVVITYGYLSDAYEQDISSDNKGTDVLYKMYQLENGELKLIETLVEQINSKGYLHYIFRDYVNDKEVSKTSNLISDQESIRYNPAYPKWFEDRVYKVKIGLTDLN